MKYTIDKQEKYSLLRLHEDKLDSSVAPNLKSELITMHAEGIRNIILDLSEVKYTDSSGLSALWLETASCRKKVEFSYWRAFLTTPQS